MDNRQPEQHDAFGYTDAERRLRLRAAQRIAAHLRAERNDPDLVGEPVVYLSDEERYGKLPERVDPQTGFADGYRR